MGNASEKFVTVAFFLQRIAQRIGKAKDRNFTSMNFPLLFLAWRGHKGTSELQRRSILGLSKGLMGRCSLIHKTLHIAKTRTVIDFEERKTAAVSARSDPAANGHVITGGLGFFGIHNQCSIHAILLEGFCRIDEHAFSSRLCQLSFLKPDSQRQCLVHPKTTQKQE